MVKPSNILESTWTLWYEIKPPKSQDQSGFYGDRLNEVCSMDSVETFHQYYSYMKTPDKLPNHSTIYIFRDRTRPMWESFPQGGCWQYRVKRDDPNLTAAWDRLVLSCVGEGIGSANVAGIVLGSRTKEFVISIWLHNGQSSEARFEIMNHLRELLQLEEGALIQYTDFHSAIQDDSSRTHAVTYRVRAPNTSRKPILNKPRKYILPDPVSGSFTFKY